ncbi:MAG TPA: Rieske (2Fe-2S) protein [Candidatus Acidoferrales bacterium]|nr:Rieske (2Fe-2S) protein [Candidatus Acidoferrales bacterium]
MSNPIRIATAAELPAAGRLKEYALGTETNETVCVANIEGKYYALDGACLHAGAPLAAGILRDGNVVCPWHGWEFDCKTGCAAHNPNIGVRRYNLTIENDDVIVEPQ